MIFYIQKNQKPGPWRPQEADDHPIRMKPLDQSQKQSSRNCFIQKQYKPRIPVHILFLTMTALTIPDMPERHYPIHEKDGFFTRKGVKNAAAIHSRTIEESLENGQFSFAQRINMQGRISAAQVTGSP